MCLLGHPAISPGLLLYATRAEFAFFSYTAGYISTPPEVAQACIELVALRYRERTRIGEISKSVGAGETVSYSQRDMSAPIMTLLQQYRAVAPIAGYPVTIAPTATDPAIVGGAL